jgi:hypothetical protein
MSVIEGKAGAPSTYRVLIPPPLSVSAAKAGIFYLKKYNTLLPTGIGEQYSQTMTIYD